jgi:Asp-tRNA(Asn)/Glu-tRNA(Gln) amidotransferase C subunit
MPEPDLSVEQVRKMADLVGIPIDDADLPEVANRFASLMQELDRLRDLDLEDVEPVTIFPDVDAG